MNLLVSTIMRNSGKHVFNWREQLVRLRAELPEHKVYLSVHENDSTDDTVDKLSKCNFKEFDGAIVTSVQLGTPKFGRVKEAERVKLLAAARNATLDQAPEFLSKADKLISIESDISYSPTDYANLIRKSEAYDVISGCCLFEGEFYDKWGTREKEQDVWYYGRIGTGIEEKWATYSCFCVYTAIPFQQGLRFRGFWNGSFDCDAAIICYELRKLGYNNIALDFDTKCEQL